jgi:transketolase
MVKTALDIAHELGGLNVWSAPTLKPINASQVAAICTTAEVIFTLEEHSTFGGLGSIVAEIAAVQNGAKIERIGISDRFSQFCGSYNYLLQEHKLDKPSILAKIQATVGN